MVRRIYVEKKAPYAVKAKELKGDLKNYLGLDNVEAVREFIRYDVENISDEIFAKACKTVFSEPPVDDLYEDNCFRDEIRQLKELLYIKEQIDETGAINDELTNKFENNNLYIKLRGDVFRMINNLKN